ncbi:hypothetical protein HYDPIDRAFT_89851 [Hydnomerulius pinastri MD-312]|uniref:Peptidase A1 domain-containing protein n=1 Tax=Hydnomerulius pinastri MD-312 TaxID=994086 RepID=A0A0C9VGM4_9AGAM|nr:hypothetical protein HYDPIDRAFT_89851 [Hydnomerulius pinastri MD-312]
MRFTLATVIAALPFLVVAAPQPHVSTAIPITKRSSLLNPDGTLNVHALESHVASAKAKVLRGLEAFEKNLGISHPLSVSQKSASGGDALIDAQDDLWYGSITVGTPAKTYNGNSVSFPFDLFLPGPKCGSSCSGHTIYDPSKSSTSKDVGKTFSVHYGDGSSVDGEQYSDTVSIAGLKATKQTLGAATQYSTGFASNRFPPDGLMGMGFQSISEYHADPVFQSLVAQGQTKAPVFAFKLAYTGAELFVGGVNPKMYKGDFTYAKVTREGYWEVAMDAVIGNGKKVLAHIDSIIDTGTTLIVVPKADAAAFYKAVGAQDASATVGDGYYSFPCDAVPKVSLSFGGKAFPISEETLNLGRVSGNTCVGGIVGADMGAGFWIVGDIFLRNVYTVFDVASSRVGFAELA